MDNKQIVINFAIVLSVLTVLVVACIGFESTGMPIYGPRLTTENVKTQTLEALQKFESTDFQSITELKSIMENIPESALTNNQEYIDYLKSSNIVSVYQQLSSDIGDKKISSYANSINWFLSRNKDTYLERIKTIQLNIVNRLS